MKRPLLKGIGLPIVLSVLLVACSKKDVNVNLDANSHNERILYSNGALPADPALLAKMHVIVSGDFSKMLNQIAGKSTGGKKTTGGTTGGTTSTTTSDITPPNINITAPTDGSSISGTVNITVNASDNVGVTSVNYSVDGSALGSSTTAPFSFSWNSSSIADGVHSLSATAFDAAGNSAVATISVTKNTTVISTSPTLPSALALTMPPVQNQGGEFACVAFSTGYYSRSAEWYYQSGLSAYGYSSDIFSPEFLYDQTKYSDCGSGTDILTALAFMQNTGICTWQTMPYSSTNGCSLLPTSSQLQEAANYKISSYSGVYKSDVTAIKNLLYNHHPLMITVILDDSFTNATPGFIWKSYSSTGGFSHAITICGFDDSKHAFKVVNSWGTGWGDQGYSWIDYDFLQQTGDQWAFVIS